MRVLRWRELSEGSEVRGQFWDLNLDAEHGCSSFWFFGDGVVLRGLLSSSSISTPCRVTNDLEGGAWQYGWRLRYVKHLIWNITFWF
jgi:hypothetical protein